jgi:hypothetical protein
VLAKRQQLAWLRLLGLAGCAAITHRSDFARCAALDASDERLMYYDKLANDLGVHTPAAEKPAQVVWQV